MMISNVNQAARLICSRTTPSATTLAASTRRVPNGSRSSRVPISAAAITLVSRSAETAAMGVRLIAQITRP